MILVFKTSVNTIEDVEIIKPYLSVLIPKSHWHIDIADCDKVLRIESKKDISSQVIELLFNNGYSCEDL